MARRHTSNLRFDSLPWVAETQTDTTFNSWNSDLPAGEWPAGKPDNVRSVRSVSAEALLNDTPVVSLPETKRKRRVSTAVRSVLAVALVLGLGCLLLRRAQEGKRHREVSQTPPLQPDWMAALTKELNQVKKLSAAAEELYSLLGGSSLDELAVIIRQRADAVRKDYSLLQEQALQGTVDEVTLKRASRRFRHDVEVFVDAADQVLSQAKVAVGRLAERMNSETRRLQEEADLLKQIAATVYRDAATVHSDLGERIAADAERNRQMFRGLVEAAKRDADVSPRNIEEALKRLESAVSHASRMQHLVRRTDKDMQEIVWWRKYAFDLPLAAMRMEGLNLRNKLRVLVEDLSTSNLSMTVVSAAMKDWQDLQELARIFGEAPNVADLLHQEDPLVLSKVVQQLRDASQEAQTVADRAWQRIRKEVEQHGPLTDAATYSVDVLAVEAFQNLAIYQGWLANTYSSFAETYVDTGASETANLHEHATVYLNHASQCAHKVEGYTASTVMEAKKAEEQAAIVGVLQHLRDARNLQEIAFLESMKAYKSSYTFSAWKRLSATAEEAFNEVTFAAKMIAANIHAGNADLYQKVQTLQQQGNAIMENFRKTKGLKHAMEHALRLKQISRELFLMQQEYSMI
ncbi:hypothetical protein ACSSS7_007015 [Eimeria intestinalis]